MAIVEDLASRRLPGFALGEHHDAALATEAMLMAAAVRGGDVEGVIYHSDKGSETTADLFRCDFRVVRRICGSSTQTGCAAGVERRLSDQERLPRSGPE